MVDMCVSENGVYPQVTKWQFLSGTPSDRPLHGRWHGRWHGRCFFFLQEDAETICVVFPVFAGLAM